MKIVKVYLVLNSLSGFILLLANISNQIIDRIISEPIKIKTDNSLYLFKNIFYFIINDYYVG